MPPTSVFISYSPGTLSITMARFTCPDFDDTVSSPTVPPPLNAHSFPSTFQSYQQSAQPVLHVGGVPRHGYHEIATHVSDGICTIFTYRVVGLGTDILVEEYYAESPAKVFEAWNHFFISVTPAMATHAVDCWFSRGCPGVAGYMADLWNIETVHQDDLELGHEIESMQV